MPDSRPDSWRPWISRVIAVMIVAMLLYLALVIWSGLGRLEAALSRLSSA